MGRCVWPEEQGVNSPCNYSYQRANGQEGVLGGSPGQKGELAKLGKD